GGHDFLFVFGERRHLVLDGLGLVLLRLRLAWRRLRGRSLPGRSLLGGGLLRGGRLRRRLLGRRHVLGGVRGVGPDGRGLSSTGGGHRVPSSGGGPCGRSATLGRSVFSAR